MLDLKNCPFCGGKATLHSPYGALGAWISCAGCGLEGPTETGVTEDEAIAAWNRRALQAVGPEPAVAGVETCKFYHSQWPVEDRLKARGPYGLITDDGEAWRYEYTHSDADGGPYDVVCRPRSALVATPPAERVVEALRTEAGSAYCRFLDKMSAPLCLGVEYKLETGKFGAAELNAHVDARELYGFHRGINHALAALATKPAVKDDETVVEALRDFVAWVDTWVSNPVGAYSVDALNGLFGMARDRIAALAAKDGRS